MNAREITRYENELMESVGMMLGAVGETDSLNSLIEKLQGGIDSGTFNSQQARFLGKLIGGIEIERHDCTAEGRKILAEDSAKVRQAKAECERMF